MSSSILSRRPSPRLGRRTLAASASVAAVSAAMLLFAAPAFAFTAHVYSSSFTGSGSDALSGPTGIAVDNSAGGEGDVYVADTANHRVEKFTASGEFILMFGEEVNATTHGNVCSKESGDVCQAGALSSAPGGFETPRFLAVDSSSGPSMGDVYVGDTGDRTVTKFTSSGVLISSWATGGQLAVLGGPLAGIALDSSGHLFASARGGGGGGLVHWYEEGGSQHSLFAYPGEDGREGLAVDAEGNFYHAASQYGVAKYSNTGVDLADPDAHRGGGVFALDPANGDLYVAETHFEGNKGGVSRFALNCGGGCTPLESFGESELGSQPSGIAIAAGSGTVYVANAEANSIAVFHATTVPTVTTGPVESPGQSTGKLTGHLDPDSAHGGGAVTECFFEYGETTEYGSKASCAPPTPYSGAENVSADISGLTPETTYHYRLLAANSNGTLRAGEDLIYTPHAVASLQTEAATNLEPTAAVLNGSFLANGEDTHYYFQWGTTTAYGSETPHQDAGSEAKPEHVSEPLSGLESATTYHFRLVAENTAGTTFGADQSFTTFPDAPLIGAESVSEVHADSALVHVQINPGGGKTAYHVEYVEDEKFNQSGFAQASQSPNLETKATKGSAEYTAPLSALAQATTYHYRVLATNADNPGAPVQGAVHTFTTLPFTPALNDSCPNAHLRQQTGAGGLLDCRAYELVSAANTGGYDVESNLVPGQSPFAGYPEAEGRVLYGVHNGGIPATKNPTNKGLDPYIASRGENGWSTEYVGIPATNPFSAAPFSSLPSGSDAGLGTIAFGAPGGCSPCFKEGYTGIPVRKPNGELVQGMSGSLNPGPAAAPAGHIAKDLSANGVHFVFGSTSQFEPDANSGGDVSIYDHNLSTGVTYVVSRTPGGATLTGPGIAELDISADGSHILVGQKVGEDAAGNPYYHLYMDVGDSASTIDLTPGASDGVLYDGMTSDGSKVFFTTKDKLSGADTDNSADLYLWEEGRPLRLVSTGTEGTGNTNACDPAANSAHEHWNVVDPAEENCGVVALGGGGGVARSDGTVYFLSPEKLDGSSSGVQNAPNLYVARPGDGYAPRFVATLESVLNGPQPPKLKYTVAETFGSFNTAAGIAVDQSNGDVYVMNLPTEEERYGGGVLPYIEKFDPSGHLISSFGDTTPTPDGRLVGRETPAGELFDYAPKPSQIAVDNDPASSSHGDLYVPNYEGGTVEKFSETGHYLASIEKSSTTTSVAVDPANGDVYATELFSPRNKSKPYVSVSTPEGAAVPAISFAPTTHSPSAVAVDPATGDVYVGSAEEKTVVLCGPSGEVLRKLGAAANAVNSLSFDSSTGELYVDEGNQIARYSSSGEPLGTVGSGNLSGSAGVAVNAAGDLYAGTQGGAKVAFIKVSLAPEGIDNPAVLDSVSSPEATDTADFQVTPSGEFAAFPSTLALAGGEEETAGHQEVYRYDTATSKLDCISCTSTGAPSAGDSSLASNGLSILGDGRVFFNSTDQLVSADTDGKQDVYELSEPGAGNCDKESTAYGKATGDCLALISAGTSPFDSGLLTASRDGKDAFFFTRDSLAPQDKNGSTMKIYDAREGGGFPYVNPEVQCQASDECHGAASAPPGPVEVGSVAGTPGNTVPGKKCKKGSVKKHGKCVSRHLHKHRRHHRRANTNRGGAQ
jgi:DNA-binding beta-propeller fold protein YncE